MTKRGIFNAEEVFTTHTYLIVVGSMGHSDKVHVRKVSVSLIRFDEIKERYLDVMGNADMRELPFHFDERNLVLLCFSLCDGVVYAGASQDQFTYGIDHDFTVVLKESEEHFEWNIDINVAICLPVFCASYQPAFSSET